MPSNFPACPHPWSHWSRRRSGWCCSPCCRPQNGWSGWTGSASLFLPRRAEGCWAASARCLSAPFLPRRDGERRPWALSLRNRAGNCLPPPHQAQAHWLRRRAAHSCGGGRFQAAQSFSGPAGAVRRPGQCLSQCRRYDSAERMPGTYFPGGCWSAGRSFVDQCCGMYTCRRHAIRRSPGNRPRKSDCRWNGPRLARRQRSRRASRRLALRAQKPGRRWSVRRYGCRRSVLRRRQRTGSRAGSRHHRQGGCWKQRPRSQSRGCPLRFWWPDLSPCAPLCSPLCPAGFGHPRR